MKTRKQEEIKKRNRRQTYSLTIDGRATRTTASVTDEWRTGASYVYVTNAHSRISCRLTASSKGGTRDALYLRAARGGGIQPCPFFCLSAAGSPLVASTAAAAAPACADPGARVILFKFFFGDTPPCISYTVAHDCEWP